MEDQEVARLTREDGFRPLQSNEIESDVDDEDDYYLTMTTTPSVDQKDKSISTEVVSNVYNIDDNLPKTVTLLKTPEGGKLYLIGTAHFSVESQNDVKKIIQEVQPHIVVVELCVSRSNILKLDEATLMEEAKNINTAKIIGAIKQNGAANGIMYILLLKMSVHIMNQLGMAPGGEFRTAFEEAKKLHSCVIHLGDRPIGITLQRAFAALSWWQTIKLGWNLLTSREPCSREDVEQCKSPDVLEGLLGEMTSQYPALGRVFIDERNTFLTHSLQVALSMPISDRNGVPVKPKVVGIVGMGHVSGIVKLFNTPQRDKIAEILIVPPPTLTSRILKKSFRLSVLGIIGYVGYKVCVKIVSRAR